jgi:lipopolysaccharide export system protein LptA
MRSDNLFSAFSRLLMVVLVFLSAAVAAQAQEKDSATVPVHIIRSDYGVHITSDTGEMDKLIGDVELEHNGTLMYCDSAYLRGASFVEAFGNVRIVQPGGTEVESDYLRYTGHNRLAFLKGNVSLTDGKDHLWCESLHYNVATKVGTYDEGGTLQSDATTVVSNAGSYQVRTKDARFTGDVHVTDPQYTVVSDDLGYNTNTKIVLFYGPSVVTNDKSVLRTSNGSWDSKQEKGFFTHRSSIQNEGQFIEADTLVYDRVTGFGNAYGNVVAIDTAQETTLYSGRADYNEITHQLWATIKPVMKKMSGTDSLFIRADTFFSAPVPMPGDTLQAAVSVQKDTVVPVVRSKKKQSRASAKAAAKATAAVKGDHKVLPAAPAPRPAPDEDTSLRYFIGYHNVRIFSDSMQGSCDSIAYSQTDSIMRLIRDPILWSRNSQITGDTILLYMDSGMLSRMYVPNKAFMISQSGPEKAQMYDQVQGRTMIGHFEDNALKDMIVWPDAESIYFVTDDDDAYLGVSQAQSERLRILFRDRRISRIIYEKNVKQSMTPLDQISIPSLRLSRFRWNPERRPRSYAELFE